MLYYDLNTTPQDGKAFYEQNEKKTRIPETDDKVKVFFQKVDLVKYDRGFDSNGYPIIIEYALQSNGTRYNHYKDVPDDKGVYQPDTAKIDADIEKQRINDINEKAQSLILSIYSLEKQSSAQLGIYGTDYLTNMKVYITNIINISNTAITNGTALKDIVWS